MSAAFAEALGTAIRDEVRARVVSLLREEGWARPDDSLRPSG